MTSCIYLLVFVSYFRYNRLSRQSRIQEVVEDDRTPFWCILTISRGDPHWIIYCILCWTVIFLEKLLHTCIYCKTKLIDENKNAKWNFDELQILSQYIQTKISHGGGSRGEKVSLLCKKKMSVFRSQLDTVYSEFTMYMCEKKYFYLDENSSLWISNLNE